VRDYQYTRHELTDGVQHVGIHRGSSQIHTTEVFISHDGAVSIEETVLHVASGRITVLAEYEGEGFEGARQAEASIDAMRHYKARSPL
jgi:hypothetical protein